MASARHTSVLADLESSEHAEIHPTRANHTEALVGAEQGGASGEGNSFLSSIDKVGILLPRLGVSSEAENSIFGLQDNLDALGKVGRSNQRHADAQVDVHSILEFLGGALDNPFTASSGVARSYYRCQHRQPG